MVLLVVRVWCFLGLAQGPWVLTVLQRIGLRQLGECRDLDLFLPGRNASQ